MSNMIVAQYGDVIVQVLDTYRMGGCEYASVEALAGKTPFVAGDRWPIRSKYGIVETAELAPVATVRRSHKIPQAVQL